MYRCDNCSKSTPLGEKIKRVVLATRPKTYTGTWRDQKTKKIQIIEIGQGNEIAREIKVCASCETKILAAMAGDGSTHRMSLTPEVVSG